MKLENQLRYLQSNLNLKAIKIYSAAKYPANRTYNEYKVAIPLQRDNISNIPSIYKCSVPIEDTQEAHLSTNFKAEDGQYAMNINLQEKLQFYYVRYKTNEQTENDINMRQYVPSLPSSVSALLLFDNVNTTYRKALSSNKSNDKKQIEDAPDSIVQPWHSSEMDLPSGYLYTPMLGEVITYFKVYILINLQIL